jgi:hypothetical protein
MGKARIAGILESDVLLKNLSITGCCLECTAYYDNIKANETYKIEVEPEISSNIENFELEAECRWVRNGDYFCEFGFQVTASPRGKKFQSYVDYLVYHSTMA